jgi:hypothetical protein
MEHDPTPRRAGEPGDDNEIGFLNVDEEGEHDERGSQGEGAGEPPARENDPAED